jgi:hypothetical protein
VLNTYLGATRRLLQNPAAPASLYSDADLTSYINTARGQLAGDSESVRFMASLPVSAGVRVYPFTAVSLAGGAGLQGVLHVRNVWYSAGSGQLYVYARAFEWFSVYELNNAAPQSGPPKMWAQYGQGAQAQTVPNPVGGGSIYVGPLPDRPYTLTLDTVCLPVPLVDDTTPEAVPALWTDAVPYFAAYLALLGAQTGTRTEEAMKMLQLYTEFVQRGRKAATPGVLPGIYPQNPSSARGDQPGAQQGAVT